VVEADIIDTDGMCQAFGRLGAELLSQMHRTSTMYSASGMATATIIESV
jgi:hypothetical protein